MKLPITIKLILLLTSFNTLAQFGGPAAVKVAKVQQVMMAPVRKIPANVQAKVLTTIKAESKGVVNKLVDIGSYIQKGQSIAELIDTQTELRSQELTDAINSASAKYEFLKSEKDRLQDLVAKNLISKTELEQNQSDFLTAKSDLSQSQSRLQQYQEQVSKLTIIAPFAGYVMQQFSQKGALLDVGDSVIEFMQAGNLEVVVYVPFKYKAQIKNQAVWQIQTQDNAMLAASISKFTPAATGNSHTIEVHLSVNADNLWSGESVTVLVPIQASKQVIAVPRDALVIRRNGTYVYTVVDNKAHKIDVKTGIAQGDLIAVNDNNLTVGDTVIVRGNERLRPQSEVKIID